MKNKQGTFSLGERMVHNYEGRTKTFLPRRSYVIIRIDGKAFHSFTSDLVKPFDNDFTVDMNDTAKYLLENIEGAKLAYVQSDEISILLTDFDKLTTQAWFDNEIQKIVSVAASMATARFNELRIGRKVTKILDVLITGGSVIDVPEEIQGRNKLAMFDARAFTLPNKSEVINYFVWRQKDAIRNSIEMTARSYYSHKSMQHKSTADLLQMIKMNDQDWNSLPVRYQRGGVFVVSPLPDKEVTEEAWNNYVEHGGTGATAMYGKFMLPSKRKQFLDLSNSCPIFAWDESSLLNMMIPENN